MQFIAYTICGAIAGVCGYLWVARFAVAYTDIALGFELSVIAACLIGGVAIAGGVGSAVGVVLGCLFIGIIRSSLPLVGISAFWQMFINGVVILVAVLLSARQREFKRTILEAAHMRAGEPASLGIDAGRWCWCSSSSCSRPSRRTSSSVDTLSDATFNFTERAIVALPLALLIIAGEIDISVAAIIALASVAMGLASAQGMGTAGIAGVGLGTGLLAGCINGALVTIGRVPSIVATIGTMTLFRGAAYAVLGDRVLKDYPESFAAFGQGYFAGPVSIELALFALFALSFGVFLHRTRWGRTIFAIGANPVASRFAGVAVNRYRFALFALTGLFSGLAAVLLTSRLGSTRPSIAQGWELEIISMVILGGVSVWGGKGSILGVVLAALVFGLVTFGLGLMNIPGIVMSIFTGTLLILVVAVPALVNRPHGESIDGPADRRIRRGQDQRQAGAGRSGAGPGNLERAPG